MAVTLRPAMPGDEKNLTEIQATSWKAAFSQILAPEILREYTDFA